MRLLWPKTFLILCAAATVFAGERIANPSLVHMRRREFIAAGVMQGLLAGRALQSPADLAKTTLAYTDALMEALDK